MYAGVFGRGMMFAVRSERPSGVRDEGTLLSLFGGTQKRCSVWIGPMGPNGFSGMVTLADQLTFTKGKDGCSEGGVKSGVKTCYIPPCCVASDTMRTPVTPRKCYKLSYLMPAHRCFGSRRSPVQVRPPRLAGRNDGRTERRKVRGVSWDLPSVIQPFHLSVY